MTDNPRLPAEAPIAALEPQPVRELLLDTNVVLDLWLFKDTRLEALRRLLAAGQWRWIASEAMLIELGHIRQRPFAQSHEALPELFEPPAHLAPAPSNPAPWRCRDADDQKFIDLAWHSRLPLWTRDRDLLVLRKKAAKDGVIIETPEQGAARLGLS
jgi:predicted nucleic acid-binding protein